MFLRQDSLSVLKVVLVIGALFGAEHIYNSSQEKQDLVDRCVQSMIFQAAKHDGFWVETDGLSTRRNNGRLVVMASASKPINWEDLNEGSGDSAYDRLSNSLYLIRCTVHQNGILTSLVVEKRISENTWDFVNPNTIEEMNKGIEVLESRREPDEN